MSLTIVVGFDDSPSSLAALDKAVDLAKLGDGRVILTAGNPRHMSLDTPRVAGGEVHVLNDAAEAAAATAREQGANVEVEVLIEAPLNALLDAAKKHAADMIVVGAKGEGALVGTVLGSTTYKLLHHLQYPVLVVPAA